MAFGGEIEGFESFNQFSLQKAVKITENKRKFRLTNPKFSTFPLTYRKISFRITIKQP
jgi:hypothetical protein